MKAWIPVVLLLSAEVFALQGEQPKLAPILEIKDWVAAGSGCFGKSHQGEVKMEAVRNPKNPKEYLVSFDLSSFALDGEKPLHAERPTFARECALRLGVYPGANWKISDLHLETEVDLQKSGDVDAEVYARLLTGSAEVQFFEKKYAKGDAQDTLMLNLAPSEFGDAHFKEVPCEEPKVLGADLSFVNKRETSEPRIKIQGKKALLRIELESCKKDKALAILDAER